jgi:hypothetical protein
MARDQVSAASAAIKSLEGGAFVWIPLVKLARADLALLKREGDFAISTTAGKKAISVRTLAGWAHDVIGDTIEGFQLKRIRSGVETLLAANGVSREVRA